MAGIGLRTIRVLIADDSALMRTMLTRILAQEPGIEVVGTARDGMDAIDKIERLHPDVVTLDIEMPRLDGVATLTEIVRRFNIPVIMVSSLTVESAEITLACLDAGAVDFVTKPSGSPGTDMESLRKTLTSKILSLRSLAHSDRTSTPRSAHYSPDRSPEPLAERLRPSRFQINPSTGTVSQRPAPSRQGDSLSGITGRVDPADSVDPTTRSRISLVPRSPLRDTPLLHNPLAGAGSGDQSQSTRLSSGVPDVIVIGSSTGGPAALHRLLPALPGHLGVPLLLVQHIPALFTGPLAARLDRSSALTVREARDGDQLEPGLVLLAPGDFHMALTKDRRIRLTSDPPLHGVRPAVDVTLQAAASIFGAGTLAVVLTGMGSDGTRGAGEIKQRGGRVLVEDESSCVVYGMPRSIVEAGYADAAYPISVLPTIISQLFNIRSVSSA